jgi:hypothetical protein
MAQYTILTTREQEAGLTYAFDHYAAEGQTKAQFLQERVSQTVLNPMVVDRHNATSIALDKSIATIPEANEAKASTEIQAVIVSNGGTLVPVGPPPSPIALARPPLPPLEPAS